MVATCDINIINMSRGTKDLREMVCSSRQSVHAKCQDIVSDEESTESFAQSPRDSITSYAKLPDIINECGFREHDPTTDHKKASFKQVTSVDQTIPSYGKNSDCRGVVKYNNSNHLLTNNTSVLLKPKASKSQSGQSGCLGSISIKPGVTRPPTASKKYGCPTADDTYENNSALWTSLETGVSFNDILQHLNKDIVETWLERVKYSVIDASSWCLSGDNFVRFAHSWMSQCSEHTRNELLDLEFNKTKEKIQLAFCGKRSSGSAIDSLLAVVLHEFANGRFFGHQGAYLFLDYMDILTSPGDYQPTLLADVHCSPTAMKLQYFEFLLSIRSFAIVEIWFALLDRYRGDENLMESSQFTQKNQKYDVRAETRSKSVQSKAAHKSIVDSSSINHEDLSKERIFQAVGLGFLDVMQFMMDTQKVSTDVRDSSNKTLVFYAAANSQPAALRYLLQQTNCGLYVNVSADSGNTPLHAAANRGDVAVTRELLKVKDIKVDACNHLCENATPLHLAAMHGYEELVHLLINAGANPSKKMGSKSVVDVANDFEHLNIVELLRVGIHSSTPRLP